MLALIFLILALVLFLIAALIVRNAGKIDLMALGLVAFTASMLVGGAKLP